MGKKFAQLIQKRYSTHVDPWRGVIGGIGLFIIAGLIMCFIFTRMIQIYQWVSLGEITLEAYYLLEPNKQVLISGVLMNNDTTEEGLVLYEWQRWEVSSKGTGKWVLDSQHVPPMQISVRGGIIKIGVPRQVEFITQGAVVKKYIPGEGPLYQKIPRDSRRLIGLANGDHISVLGSKRQERSFSVIKVFAGDRKHVFAATLTELRSMSLGIVILFGLGSVLLHAAKHDLSDPLLKYEPLR